MPVGNLTKYPVKNPLFLFSFRYVGEDGNDLLTDYVDHLNATIMKTFDINLEQAARLQMELRQCVRKKNLVNLLFCGKQQLNNFSKFNMTSGEHLWTQNTLYNNNFYHRLQR